jgi:hypothetical protein
VLVEGRWNVPSGSMPYGEGAERLPWSGGVTADRLGAALAPLVDELHTERLDDPALWGRPIDDERYAVVGLV